MNEPTEKRILLKKHFLCVCIRRKVELPHVYNFPQEYFCSFFPSAIFRSISHTRWQKQKLQLSHVLLLHLFFRIITFFLPSHNLQNSRILYLVYCLTTCTFRKNNIFFWLSRFEYTWSQGQILYQCTYVVGGGLATATRTVGTRVFSLLTGMVPCCSFHLVVAPIKKS